MKSITTAIFILLFLNIHAQRLSGVVKSDKGELLPFASISINGTSKGTTANEQAKYAINLKPGKYTIVCHHIGYATDEKTIEIDGDKTLNFLLLPQKLSLQEVVVNNNAEDPAYEIIRNAIKNRAKHLNETSAFSCNLYSKDLIKMRSVPDKFFGKKIKAEDKRDMGVDSTGKGIVYLSENIATIYKQQPDKFKMDIHSSRVSGSNGFGFTIPAFISLYNNNVIIFTDRLNPRGFVSPVADGAIGYYKYKFLGSFFENGKEINTIRVTPRRAYEPLFSGVINITEGDWRIYSLDLLLTKRSQLELLDTLKLVQLLQPVGENKWMVKNQLIQFAANQFGFGVVGNFLNVYSDYNLAPNFSKKFFDKVLMKYDTAVNKKTREYWDSIRPVPLENEEVNDYRVRDSSFKATIDSLKSKRHLDSINRAQKKLKPLSLLKSDYYKTHYSGSSIKTFGVNGILPNMEYNTVEGIVANIIGTYSISSKKSRHNMRIEPFLRYGFSNRHFNAFANVTLSKRDSGTLNRSSIVFSGGKRVTEFNRENVIVPLFNAYSTLIDGRNNLKIYENYYGLISYKNSLENGLRYNVNLLYEDRLPLENTTDFIFVKKNKDGLTANYPVELLNAQFIRHQAMVLSLGFRFQPGQRFIQFPYNKVAIGSRYPTFNFEYAKGLPWAGSDANFDKWKLKVDGDKNLKLLGKFSYSLGAGGFINTKAVPVQDFHHFNGNTGVLAGPYLNSFQLAPYYANSTTAPLFGFGHAEHHFNGLLTNKLPLFRKLNWHLVAGSNAFYVNKKSNYVEVFAGIENIFKILRIDFVAAYNNGSQGITGIRIGFGGLLGGGSVRVGNGFLSKSLPGNFTGK